MLRGVLQYVFDLFCPVIFLYYNIYNNNIYFLKIFIVYYIELYS